MYIYYGLLGLLGGNNEYGGGFILISELLWVNSVISTAVIFSWEVKFVLLFELLESVLTSSFVVMVFDKASEDETSTLLVTFLWVTLTWVSEYVGNLLAGGE